MQDAFSGLIMLITGVCTLVASLLVLGFMVDEFGMLLGIVLSVVFFPIVALIVPFYDWFANGFWVTAALGYIPLLVALMTGAFESLTSLR